MKFLKNKKSLLFVLVFVFVFSLGVLSACSSDPIVAYFTDGTSAGSDNYTVNVDYDEDSRFNGKYVDVLIKSDMEQLNFLFKREFDEDTELFLEEKDKWYSITKLLNSEKDQKEEFQAFKGKADDTLVIKSEQKAKVKLKVVAGDLKENSEGEEILINQTDVSKVFELDLGKNLD